jgi:hypothetical protein
MEPPKVAPTEAPPSIATSAAPSTLAASDLAAQNALFHDAMAKARTDPTGAALLFTTFVDRYPGSPLQEAALAHRMRLLARAHDERAPTAAREYMRLYPNGFARSDAVRIAEEH